MILINDKLKDIIRLLLTPNPEKRPSIDQIEKIFINYDNVKEIELTDDA